MNTVSILESDIFPFSISGFENALGDGSSNFSHDMLLFYSLWCNTKKTHLSSEYERILSNALSNSPPGSFPWACKIAVRLRDFHKNSDWASFFQMGMDGVGLVENSSQVTPEDKTLVFLLDWLSIPLLYAAQETGLRPETDLLKRLLISVHRSPRIVALKFIRFAQHRGSFQKDWREILPPLTMQMDANEKIILEEEDFSVSPYFGPPHPSSWQLIPAKPSPVPEDVLEGKSLEKWVNIQEEKEEYRLLKVIRDGFSL